MRRAVITACALAVVATACPGGDSGPDPLTVEDTTPAAEVATTTTAPPPSTTTTALPCPAGGEPARVEGVNVRRFCGPARAVLRVGMDVHVFAPGLCVPHDDWIEVHLGVEVVEPAAEAAAEPRFRSFTLFVGRHPLESGDPPAATTDGTYHAGIISFSVPGAAFAVEDKTITLADQRTTGDLAGVAFRAGTPEPLELRGAFACDAGGASALDDRLAGLREEADSLLDGATTLPSPS
jgi:hypothetical protein